MADTSVKWLKVDVTTLPKNLQVAYAALQEANAAARERREAFEAEFLADLAKNGKAEARAALKAGRELKYGYKFGQFAVAFVEATEKKAKGAVSLF